MADQDTDDCRPFVIEGVLSDLHTELSSENLLRKVMGYYKENSLVTGMGTAIGDLFGQAADSAMLAMYDGEYSENFICLIGDRVVCGTFGGASKLREGNQIRAVVCRQGKVLVAHAILDETQGLIWIKHPWGLQAERTANFKLALWLGAFATVGLTIMDIVAGPALASGSHLEFAMLAALVSAAICLVVGLWSSSDMKALAVPSTEFFRMLGFSRPEKLNFNRYQYSIVFRDQRLAAGEMEYQYHDVYCYKQAIQDGRAAMAH